MFFLKGKPLEVGLVTTENFLHFTEYGVVIPAGNDISQDRKIGTGCVFEQSGKYVH